MGIIIDYIEHNFNKIKEISREICNEYDNARYITIGKSIVGRDIGAIIIGESREYVLYVGGIHGSERLTVVLLLKFASELCRSLRDGTPISDVKASSLIWDKGLIIVPLANPDGYEIAQNGYSAAGVFSNKVKRLSNGDTTHWNSNARGVDLNHNFNSDWEKLRIIERQSGVFGAGAGKYGGERPESEPETQALVKLCEDYNIRHLFSFHSQGEVIFPPEPEKQIPRADRMAQIMAISSGYKIEFPTGTAVGGGLKDWFADEFHRPGFTIEIGKGKNPLPMSDLHDIYPKLKELLALGILL